jgi:hypothetical protein
MAIAKLATDARAGTAAEKFIENLFAYGTLTGHVH